MPPNQKETSGMEIDSLYCFKQSSRKMTTFSIATLGCKVNQFESEGSSDHLS